MKKILFILAINFLIHRGGTVHYMLSGPVSAFLSIFDARSSGKSEETSKESEWESDSDSDSDPDPDPDPKEALEIERLYEPLQLTLVSFDGKTLEGLIGNPMFLRHDIHTLEFVDAIYACPKKESDDLVLERSYISFKNKYIEEANLSEEKNEDNANNAQGGESGKVGSSNSNQKQYPNQQKTETEPASSQKPSKIVEPIIKRSAETLTTKNEFYWLKALNDVENFKCEKPVKPVLLPVPSDDLHTNYIAGFRVHVDEHDFEYEKFIEELTPNQKIKFLWSLVIIFSKLDQSVYVYHEVQYNKDTFNPQINENFDDHDFGKSELFPDLDITQLYEIENQEKVFGELFEKEDERKKYFDVDGGRFLERLHLAPLHGFLSSAMRQSAKTYGNIAPMWNSIKTGAWNRLEEYVNTLATVLKHLVVITGTYGILKLNGKEVYLANDKKIQVPLVFWKMVIYPHNLDKFPGILFVTSNNPYEDIGNVICKEDKCKEFEWDYVREEELTRGRTVCCDFTTDILNELPVLKGTQPSKVLTLNLDELSPFVDKAWELDEQGERTSMSERHKILHKIKKYKKSEKEMITADEKSGQFVDNEDTEMKDARYEDVQNEDAEKKDLNGNKEIPKPIT